MLDAVATITPEQFIRPMGNSFNSVRDTVAHICAAERIWITRLKGEKPEGLQKPDRLPDVDAARKEWAELEGEMREQLARLGPEDVERTIEYPDLRGNDQSDVLWQMLQHVVNHGTYHRGQITTVLRQLDATPPKSMDLITFLSRAKSEGLTGKHRTPPNVRRSPRELPRIGSKRRPKS